MFPLSDGGVFCAPLYIRYRLLTISEEPLSMPVRVQFVTPKESVIYISEGEKPLLPGVACLKEQASRAIEFRLRHSKLTSSRPLRIFATTIAAVSTSYAALPALVNNPFDTCVTRN